MSGESKYCARCEAYHTDNEPCMSALGHSSFARPPGSVRTCEWETVAPPKICAKPAVFATQGKYLCQEHGAAINHRWPGTAKSLKAPNE